jgi:hypothetical protein
MNSLHQLWLQNGELLQQLQLTRNHFHCSDILIFLQITLKANINLHLHFASAWYPTCKGNNWNDWGSCMEQQSFLEMTFYCLENVAIITTWGDNTHGTVKRKQLQFQHLLLLVVWFPFTKLGTFMSITFCKILLQRNKLTKLQKWNITTFYTAPYSYTGGSKLFCRYNAL